MAEPQRSEHELNARLLRFRSRPESEEPRQLAKDLLAVERYGDARGVVIAAQPPGEFAPDLLVLEGRAWMAEGELTRALDRFLGAVRLSPEDADPYRWLARALMLRGDPLRAQRALEQSLDLDPACTETRDELAKVQSAVDRARVRLLDDAERLGSAAPPAPTMIAAERRAVVAAERRAGAAAAQRDPETSRPAASARDDASMVWEAEEEEIDHTELDDETEVEGAVVSQLDHVPVGRVVDPGMASDDVVDDGVLGVEVDNAPSPKAAAPTATDATEAEFEMATADTLPEVDGLITPAEERALFAVGLAEPPPAAEVEDDSEVRRQAAQEDADMGSKNTSTTSADSVSEMASVNAGAQTADGTVADGEAATGACQPSTPTSSAAPVRIDLPPPPDWFLAEAGGQGAGRTTSGAVVASEGEHEPEPPTKDYPMPLSDLDLIEEPDDDTEVERFPQEAVTVEVVASAMQSMPPTIPEAVRRSSRSVMPPAPPPAAGISSVPPVPASARSVAPAFGAASGVGAGLASAASEEQGGEGELSVGDAAILAALSGGLGSAASALNAELKTQTKTSPGFLPAEPVFPRISSASVAPPRPPSWEIDPDITPVDLTFGQTVMDPAHRDADTVVAKAPMPPATSGEDAEMGDEDITIRSPIEDELDATATETAAEPAQELDPGLDVERAFVEHEGDGSEELPEILEARFADEDSVLASELEADEGPAVDSESDVEAIEAAWMEPQPPLTVGSESERGSNKGERESRTSVVPPDGVFDSLRPGQSPFPQVRWDGPVAGAFSETGSEPPQTHADSPSGREDDSVLVRRRAASRKDTVLEFAEAHAATASSDRVSSERELRERESLDRTSTERERSTHELTDDDAMSQEVTEVSRRKPQHEHEQAYAEAPVAAAGEVIPLHPQATDREELDDDGPAWGGEYSLEERSASEAEGEQRLHAVNVDDPPGHQVSASAGPVRQADASAAVAAGEADNADDADADHPHEEAEDPLDGLAPLVQPQPQVEATVLSLNPVEARVAQRGRGGSNARWMWTAAAVALLGGFGAYGYYARSSSFGGEGEGLVADNGLNGGQRVAASSMRPLEDHERMGDVRPRLQVAPQTEAAGAEVARPQEVASPAAEPDVSVGRNSASTVAPVESAPAARAKASGTQETRMEAAAYRRGDGEDSPVLQPAAVDDEGPVVEVRPATEEADSPQEISQSLLAVMLEQRDLAAAEARLSALKPTQRRRPEVRLAEARLRLQQGREDRALAILEPMRRRHPSADLFALLGEALYAKGHVNGSAGQYESALALDGEHVGALLGRAEVHLRAGNPRAALPLLQLAAQRLAQFTLPEAALYRVRRLSLLGHAYLQRAEVDDRERALAALAQAVNMPFAPAEAYFWLGESLSGRRSTEAAQAYRTYLDMAPGGRYVERALRALGPL